MIFPNGNSDWLGLFVKLPLSAVFASYDASSSCLSEKARPASTMAEPCSRARCPGLCGGAALGFTRTAPAVWRPARRPTPRGACGDAEQVRLWPKPSFSQSSSTPLLFPTSTFHVLFHLVVRWCCLKKKKRRKNKVRHWLWVTESTPSTSGCLWAASPASSGGRASAGPPPGHSPLGVQGSDALWIRHWKQLIHWSGSLLLSLSGYIFRFF